MSTASEFERTLGRAAAIGVTDHSRTHTPAHATRCLLERLDTCVLGREITMRVNGDVHLVAHVKDRSILRITFAQATPALKAIAGHSLTDTPDIRRDLHALLTAVCKSGVSIAIEQRPLSSPREEGRVGVPVSALLEMQERQAAPPTPEAHIAAISFKMAQWQRFDPPSPELDAAIAHVSRLQDSFQWLPPQEFALVPHSGPFALALRGDGVAAVLCIKAGNAMSVPADVVEALFSDLLTQHADL